jgi:hypothetical protein
VRPTQPQIPPIRPTAPGWIGFMAPASRCPRDAGALYLPFSFTVRTNLIGNLMKMFRDEVSGSW